jgi:cell division protease FtsH
MTEEALEYAVKRTGDFVVGAAGGTKYSGDHLNALCRSVARLRLRENLTGETTTKEIERALTEWIDRPKMTKAEERVLATHEAGHAVVALHCDHAPPIERITIASEMQWAFGYVRYADHAHKYIQTVNMYLDLICVALGAREAERLLLDDLSLGATGDLHAATAIARELVEAHGLAGGALGQVQFLDMNTGKRRDDLSPETLRAIDERVAEIVEEQRKRAEAIVMSHRKEIELLRDLLLEKKTIDAKALGEIIPDNKNAAKREKDKNRPDGTDPAAA